MSLFLVLFLFLTSFITSGFVSKSLCLCISSITRLHLSLWLIWLSLQVGIIFIISNVLSQSLSWSLIRIITLIINIRISIRNQCLSWGIIV